MRGILTIRNELFMLVLLAAMSVCMNRLCIVVCMLVNIMHVLNWNTKLKFNSDWPIKFGCMSRNYRQFSSLRQVKSIKIDGKMYSTLKFMSFLSCHSSFKVNYNFHIWNAIVRYIQKERQTIITRDSHNTYIQVIILLDGTTLKNVSEKSIQSKEYIVVSGR